MKKIFSKAFVALLFPFFLSIAGCGPELPEGMPKLYPCTLTITQDGKPLEGASVILFSMDPNISKWASNGVTDSSGNVVMKTQGKYDGAAAGDYKVLVTKIIVEEGVVLQAETETTPEKSIPGKTFSYVEQQYGDPLKCPLTLTVSTGKTTETLDVGKYVKEEIRSN